MSEVREGEADIVGTATIEGPITGGAHGWPFGCSGLDLSSYGYREDEYFLSGTATSYRLLHDDPPHDGIWDCEPAGTAPYRTRILVQAPTDPSRFSGTVVVSWNNVTAGYELFNADWVSAWEQGHAVVSVTCQKVGITGLPDLDQGMAPWDPERYGTLSITSDDDSYDIFSQAAKAVGPHRAIGEVDPMAGLEVEHLVAFGASQSAGRLATYVNAIQPRTGIFDAVILAIYFGRGTALQVGDAVVNIMASPNTSGSALRGANLVRDDGSTKVMVVNSELEAIACHAVRQPDTDTFRWWESAGTCHVSAQSLATRAEPYQRNFGRPAPQRGGSPNRVPIQPLYDSALAHIHRWIDDGTPPPGQPLVDFDASAEKASVVRDDDGIATGGIRLPQVEVPLATNSAVPDGPGIFAILDGTSTPFPPEEITKRYGDVDGYLQRFETAIDAGEAAGFLLPGHRAGLLAEARAEFEASTSSR